jgi:hypothetical protein
MALLFDDVSYGFMAFREQGAVDPHEAVGGPAARIHL